MGKNRFSSEFLGTLLLQLLKENDNSLNFYDDSEYLYSLISSLGNINNPYLMDSILQEVVRQAKLDLVLRYPLL